MASTNKTEILGLNLWTQDDIPKREDFVSDNEKIDDAVGKIRESELKFVTVEYTGNGKSMATFSLETEPKCIFITCQEHADCELEDGKIMIYGGTFINEKIPKAVIIRGTKVIIKQAEGYCLNGEGLEYCLSAIC